MDVPRRDAGLLQRRSQRLTEFRCVQVPSKRADLRMIEQYLKTGTLRRDVCERVFQQYSAEQAIVPRYARSESRAERQRRNRTHRRLLSRLVDMHQLTFTELNDNEQAHVMLYVRHLRAWIDYVSSARRDTEVAFDQPHPVRIPPLYASEECLIHPTLRCKYDDQCATHALRAETETILVDACDVARMRGNGYVESADQTGVRHGQWRMERIGIPGGASITVEHGCGHCRAPARALARNSSGTVTCTECGHESRWALMAPENPLWSIPFSAGTINHVERRQSYEMTRNFAKVIDLLQGRDEGKATSDVVELCRQRLCESDPREINHVTVRTVLQRAQLPQYYQYVPAILIKLGHADKVVDLRGRDNEVLGMHIQYSVAFEECPSKVRCRKSSLRNFFLCRMFFLMLGMTDSVHKVPTLEGESKRRNHEKTFRWIVQWVRDNLIPEEDLETTPWRWVTPVYD